MPQGTPKRDFNVFWEFTTGKKPGRGTRPFSSSNNANVITAIFRKNADARNISEHLFRQKLPVENVAVSPAFCKTFFHKGHAILFAKPIGQAIH
jgi:hypothetical protein